MKRGKFLAILFAAIMALSPAAAFADELMDLMELEELLFTEIPEVESTGFFKVKQTKAPGYTTVITSKQIEDGSARTLAELIGAHVPGMVQNAHESYGSIIGVRGVAIDNNSKTLVMYDGQDITHHSSFGYANEYDLPLLGDIAKVEVANGPGAIVHGSGAIGGFVNLIPKNGSDYNGFVATAEFGGTEESYKTEMSYGMTYGEGKDLFIYAGFVKAHGVKAQDTWDYNTLNADADSTSGVGQRQFLRDGILAHGNPDPSYKFSLVWNHDMFNLNMFYTDVSTYRNSPQGSYPSEEWGNRPNATPVFTHPWGFNLYQYPVWDDNGFETQTLGLRPKLDLKLTDDEALELSANFAWMQHSYDIQKEELMPVDPISGWMSDGAGSIDTYRAGGKEFNASAKAIFKTTRDVPGLESNGFAIGGLIGRREFERGDQYFHSGLEEYHESSEDHETETGAWHESSVFAEEVMELNKQLLFAFGVRYDQATYSDLKGRETWWGIDHPKKHENVSHRLAAAYEINENNSVKLSYQEGFRYPDQGYYTYTSYFQNAAGEYNTANGTNFDILPDLEPETMNSTEINFHTAHPAFNLMLDVNAYYNVYEKTLHWHDYYNDHSGIYLPNADIVTIADGHGDYWMGAMANAPGKFRSVGAEMKLSWQPAKSATFDLIYGYSEPQGMDPDVASSLLLTTSTKQDWMRYPKHTVKFNSTFRLLDEKFTLNLSTLYNSGFSLSKAGAATINETYSKSRFLVDVATRYQFTDNLSLKFNVKNLFKESTPRMTNYGDPNSGALGDERRYWYLSAQYEF